MCYVAEVPALGGPALTDIGEEFIPTLDLTTPDDDTYDGHYEAIEEGESPEDSPHQMTSRVIQYEAIDENGESPHESPQQALSRPEYGHWGEPTERRPLAGETILSACMLLYSFLQSA